MAEGVRYIKVSKIDENGADQTNTLQNINDLTIPFSSGAVTYNILNTSEFPTYFLYYVENPNLEWDDRADIKYDFTGSISTSGVVFPISSYYLPITSITDPLDFFVSGSFIRDDIYVDVYKYFTYPQKSSNFHLTGSLVIGMAGGSSNITASLFNGVTQIYTEGIGVATGLGTTNLNVDVDYSITPTLGDRMYWRIDGSSPITAGITFNGYYKVSSTPATGPTIESIPEPYFSENFSKDLDCQPLLNNVIVNRSSTQYQDIDYSTGLLIPTNFDLLINGTALKANVQDSNYTLKRHTNPRYEGSRTTSQNLNKWTLGDINTYGKSPSVESLKTLVVYCDGISGYTPERMNSSAAHVVYLIKEDGSVVIPNTTENSLADLQNTFITGERFIINSNDQGTGEPTQIRNIIRGGQRIEPIMYTQISHTPPSWATEINLSDNNIPGSVVSDFQALLSPSTPQAIPNSGLWGEVKFPNIISSGSNAFLVDTGTTKRLEITPGMITEGISITLKAELKITNGNQLFTTNPRQVWVQFKNINTGAVSGWATLIIPYGAQSQPLNTQWDIPFGDLVENDEYTIEIAVDNFPGTVYYESTSRFYINQSPVPNSSINIANLWISGSGFPETNVLYTTSSALITYFNTNNAYQEDIPLSDFNPISIPWSIKTGDEFRFEGREDRTFMVKNAYTIDSFFGSLLVVDLDKPLPPSGSINYDQFLIRRYVEDAGTILMEGFKPIGSQGPYILTPEYTTPNLNKNVDTIITDLTERGLI